MPLTREQKGLLHSGGAAGRVNREQGDSCDWWTIDGEDPAEEEPMIKKITAGPPVNVQEPVTPVTPKISGNRLIDIEELVASIGALSSVSSSTSSEKTEVALDDFAAYL
jgi:hypothetical protein